MNRAFEFFEKDKAPQWEPRNEYFKFYQTLNNVKHTQQALAAGIEGGEMVKYPAASDDLYVFSREKGDSKVVVLTNLGKETQKLDFKEKTPEVKGLKAAFPGAEASLPASLEPGQYLLFVKN